MAAFRLQAVSDRLEEAARDGNAASVDQIYGGFLFEIRSIKEKIAKLSDATVNLDQTDHFIKEYSLRVQGSQQHAPLRQPQAQPQHLRAPAPQAHLEDPQPPECECSLI